MRSSENTSIDLAKTTIGTFNIADGMRWLLDRLSDSVLDSVIRKKLSKLDYVADARLIRQRIERHFMRGDIDARNTELYFGLDSLNMPRGKGIEFGCGERSDEYTNYPGEVRSTVLKRVFSLVEGNVGEIALAIGFLGLALKQAFTEIAPEVLLGVASQRRIVFGFHDGDLFELGRVTRDGFALTLDFKPPSAEIEPTTSVAFPWPSEGSGRADWLYASGLIAVGIKDEEDRASEMTLVAKMLCSIGRFREAEHLVRELMKIERRLSDAGQRVKILACSASVAAGLGDIAAAGEYLRQGKSVAEAIAEQYWRGHAIEDMVWCADLLGMVEVLGMTTPDGLLRAEVAKRLVEADEDSRAGRTEACRDKIDELNGRLRRETGIVQERHGARLLELCDKAGDADLVLSVYESAPKNDWKWWDVVGPLWRNGARDEASTWLEDRFADAENDQRLRGTGNHHFPMNQMESVAKTYRKLGDAQRFDKTLRRIEQCVRAWKLSETGWISAAVFTGLGRLQALGGERDAARATLLAAKKAVKGERTASDRAQGWKSLAAAYCDLEAWDEAIECAKQIRDPNGKREAIAKAYLRAKRWNELRGILDTVNDAAQASKLAFWLSWVFDEEL